MIKTKNLILQISNDSLMPVLLDLKELCILDWSDDREAGTRDPFEIFSPVRARVSQLLRATNHLPKLISLDVSGKFRYCRMNKNFNFNLFKCTYNTLFFFLF